MTLVTKIHNDLLAKVKGQKLRKLYFNAQTLELADGEEGDLVPVKLFECGPVDAAWEDSGNRLENSPKDQTQWTWLMRVGYPALVDFQSLLRSFETVTWFPGDASLGTPPYRVELIECDFSEPERGGPASPASKAEITLNIEIMRR